MNEAERQLSSVLSEFARTMLTDFPIQGILDHLVLRIVDILPITGAGVALISPTTAPHYVAASDNAALRFEQLQTELGEGPCLAAYRTGEAVAVTDLRSEGRFDTFVPRAIAIGLAAVFTFPSRQGGDRLGALDLYRNTAGTLSDEDMVTAQTLADVTAAYLLNAKARAGLQDSSDHFRQSSVHDPLTGLPNRVLLLERIEHAITRSGRSKKLVALLFIDLDDFKRVNDVHGALDVLGELKELGVLLALDDFGTGHSSLSYLRRFPVDTIKIDQSFIADLVGDRSSHAIVSKTIELAHMLDLAVVCEGIETREQHSAVTVLGSDFCQGFYFGRPIGAHLVDQLVAARP